MAGTTKSKSLENRKKVVSEMLKDPTKSEREIAMEVGVPKSTVHDISKRSGEIGRKSPDIVEICNNDKRIIELGQRIIEEKLMDQEYVKNIRPGEIASVMNGSTTRYSNFMGDATDNKGGAKQQIVFLPEKDLHSIDE